MNQLLSVAFVKKINEICGLDDSNLVYSFISNQYLNWAENIEPKRVDYIVEALYHKLILLEIEKNSNKLSNLSDILESMILKYYKDDGIQEKEALVELKEQLESDRDFKDLLQQKDLQQLLKLLHS